MALSSATKAKNGTLGAIGLFSAAILTSTVLSSAAAHAGDWTTAVNSATKIPGGGGKLFSSFGQPSINDRCVLVFRGRTTGPSEPVRGVYAANPCLSRPVSKVAAAGDLVPSPNNNDAPFTEFPAFPRIESGFNFVATRGQSEPVWTYTLEDLSETKVGTSGIYAGLLTSDLITGASQLGAVPDFSQFEVPGFPGVKFDQFPGAASPFDSKGITFKGNFTDGTTGRTGVYMRYIYRKDGLANVRRIADTTMNIPGTSTPFGSTAPPSAAKSSMVFTGLDIEEAPTMGGIYRSVLPPNGSLETMAEIGQTVPVATTIPQTFTQFGEGLSYDGSNLGFWGAWGSDTRTVTLHCPADGNTDIIAECQKQCPDVDEIGNYCTKEVPVHQGIFVRTSDGKLNLIARAGVKVDYQDFLFWVFSGRPPGTGPAEAEDSEPPRWRASAFVAISPNGTTYATAFKALKHNGEVGIYKRRKPTSQIESVAWVSELASRIDTAAPEGSRVSAVGLERDGFRNCKLAMNASFLNETTSESWAGVYVDQDACN